MHFGLAQSLWWFVIRSWHLCDWLTLGCCSAVLCTAVFSVLAALVRIYLQSTLLAESYGLDRFWQWVSFFLRFNGHFPGGPELAGTRMSPFGIHWRRWVVTTGAAIRRAKLQSNRHHQQTNVKRFTGRMPFPSPNQQCRSKEKRFWRWLYGRKIFSTHLQPLEALQLWRWGPAVGLFYRDYSRLGQILQSLQKGTFGDCWCGIYFTGLMPKFQ